MTISTRLHETREETHCFFGARRRWRKSCDLYPWVGRSRLLENCSSVDESLQEWGCQRLMRCCFVGLKQNGTRARKGRICMNVGVALRVTKLLTASAPLVFAEDGYLFIFKIEGAD